MRRRPFRCGETPSDFGADGSTAGTRRLSRAANLPEEDILLLIVILAALVAFIAAVVVWGYPALIIGALVGVALAFVVILAFTADGLRPRGGSTH